MANTPPYAQILISRNGGATASGGITCAFSDSIQLSAQNTSGWGQALWEIYDFPPGFSLPAGWSLNPVSGAYYFQPTNPTTLPPAFALPASGANNWGKFALRLRINGNPLARNPDGSPTVGFVQQLTDESTMLKVLSPVRGLSGIAANETTQFDAIRAWVGDLMASLRLCDTSGGGGSSVTGTGWWHSAAGVLDAAAVTMGDSSIVAGAFVIAALSSASAIPVTTALSFGTNPAAAGALRHANGTTAVAARNAGNTADLQMLYTVSNTVCLGDSNNSKLSLRSGTEVEVLVAGTAYLSLKNLSTDFLALGGASASAGLLRVSNNATAVAARNAANTQNIPLLGTDGSNNVQLGDSAGAQGALTVLNGTTGLSLKVAGVQVGSLAAASGDFLALGVTPAASGVIRLTNGQSIKTKNNVGTTFPLIECDVSNQVNIGDSAAIGLVQIFSGGNIINRYTLNTYFINNGTFVGAFEGTNFEIGGAAGSYGGGSGVMALLNATTAPTTAPTGNTILWVDALGLHTTPADGASFVDYMIAPVKQGTANTQALKIREYLGVARTTTSAAVTILTIPLATAASNGGISVVVEGRDVTSGSVGDGVTIQQVFQFKNVAGTVTQGATLATPLKANDTSMATCTCTATPSGTNILVQVTGLASVVIDWTAVGRAITN